MTAAALVSNEWYVRDSILYGADEMVADFVAAHIPHMQGASFGERHPVTGLLPYAALGVIRGDNFVGGAVYYNWRTSNGRWVDVEMSAAFEPKCNWCNRATLRELFWYPFVTADCLRMTTITGRKNKAARKADVSMGFKLEGVARKAIDGHQDAMIYGMLRGECKWIAPR